MEEQQPKEETREDKPEQTVVVTSQKSLKKMARDAAIFGIVILFCLSIMIIAQMVQIQSMRIGGLRFYSTNYMLIIWQITIGVLAIAYAVYYIIITVKYGNIKGYDDVVRILLIVGLFVPILDVVGLFMCAAAEDKRVPIEQKIIKG